MHSIGLTVSNLNKPGLSAVELWECDTCGVAVSDPDLHKLFTGHDQ